MEIDTPVRRDHAVRVEEDSGDTRIADDKPTYRSWKKKYRKMRIVFDRKMHEGEGLHLLEEKALATARRLAVEKDKLLDLLLDINNSPQIPSGRRFDLSLDPPSDPNALGLPIDDPSAATARPGVPPDKSYRKLLAEVPHRTYATVDERLRNLLEPGRDSLADPSQGAAHPPSFLTADMLDNYLWETDMRIARATSEHGGTPLPPLPTLVPLAQSAANGGAGGLANGAGAADLRAAAASRDFALRNPTSVYNWLRKHAPKTFLQDTESHGPAEKENGGGGAGGDDHHNNNHGTGRGHGRGSGKGGERGKSGDGSGTTRSKRTSAAHVRDKNAIATTESTEYLDDDVGYEARGTPAGAVAGTAAGGGGKGSKRKRGADDDPGYRPKGGSSRPTKKKRKSAGDGESTPTAAPKKSRKSVGVDSVTRDD